MWRRRAGCVLNSRGESDVSNLGDVLYLRLCRQLRFLAAIPSSTISVLTDLIVLLSESVHVRFGINVCQSMDFA